MAGRGLFPGVALVTGAGGSGIGAATAKAFVKAGCGRIAVTDINEQSLQETVESIRCMQPETEVVQRTGSIADETFVDSLIEEITQRWSRLDYAVNCAGILGSGQRSTDTSTEDFDRINAVNYRGCWLCSRAELKQMLKQDPLSSHDSNREPQRGAVVNVASQLGVVGRPDAPAYCSSKAAVIALTRSDAIDYAKDGIRVNCVCPGLIETPMTGQTPALRERFRPAVDIAPMKRMGKPAEVADAILFLCSTQASFVQGHALVVDGGYVIN